MVHRARAFRLVGGENCKRYCCQMTQSCLQRCCTGMLFHMQLKAHPHGGKHWCCWCPCLPWRLRLAPSSYDQRLAWWRS